MCVAKLHFYISKSKAVSKRGVSEKLEELELEEKL